jgi:hypothetical protein
MSSGQIVAIVVLVVLVALVVAAVMVFRRRSPDQRRLEAAQHRREAEQRFASAERLEAEAAQRAERARAEQAQAAELAAMARHDREVAERAQATALRLDPDTPVEPATRTATPPAVDQDQHRRDDRRDGERPRRSEYVEPEPIVGGAAAGLLSNRTRRSEDHAAADGAVVPAQRTGSPADERPTVSLAASDGKDTPPVRPANEPTDRGRGSDPADATRGSGDTATAERADDGERPTNPVRHFADRIMGRS